MPGPKPTPTAIKIIQGNPGKRKLPKSEPKPRVIKLNCPEWLHKYAKAEWKRIVPELEALGLLTVVDAGALAACCQSFARWRMAEEIIGETSLGTIGAKGGKVLKPEVDASQKYLEKYRALCAEFGLTPASRTRLSVEKPKGKSRMQQLVVGDS